MTRTRSAPVSPGLSRGEWEPLAGRPTALDNQRRDA
jgi:hypothetical protein